MKTFFFFLSLTYCFLAIPQQPFLKFNHITVEDGLTHEDVNVITQDAQGFIWFGTADGLNRYDGYEIKTYKHSDNDTNSLSFNWVWSLHVDKKGRLWVGTRQGLNLYKNETDNFERIKFDGSFTSRPNINVNSIASSDSNQIWIGTWEDGLISYNTQTKKALQFRYDSLNESSISSDKVGCVVTDKDNNLWLGTWDGINRLKKDNKFERYYQKDGIAGNKIITLYPDPEGGVWAGTSLQGLTYLNPARNTITNFINNPSDNNSISGNVVTALATDKEGQLWVGTYVAGLNYYNKEANVFGAYKHDPIDNKSILANNIKSLFVDRSGALWIGSKGVSVLDQFNNRFLHIRAKQDSQGLNDNAVWAFEEDQKGNIWIGTEKGINQFIPSTGQIKSRESDLFNIIYSIEYDKENNRLWLGTEKPILVFFDLNKEIFYEIRPKLADKENVLNDDINTIHKMGDYLYIGTYQKGAFRYHISSNYMESLNQLYNFESLNFSTFISDNDGNLILGTIGDGVIKINPEESNVRFYKNIADDTSSLSDNIVYSLFFDGDKNLWVGTSKGLNKLEKRHEDFIRYSRDNGLPNEAICGVVTDLYKNVWISTYSGISKYDSEQHKFINFDYKHGLQGNNFNENAQFIDSRGNIYFGGKNGLTMFHPDEIKKRNFKPNLVFTSFQVNSEEKDRLLNEEQIVLPSNKNFIRIGFSSLDFAIPEKNKYQYKLEGVDKDWQETSENYVNYTDLPPGKYTFLLKGSNSGGEWLSDEAFLNIKILPPWYLSWVAFCFYALVFLLLIFSYRRSIYKKAAIMNELKMKDFETKKIKELDNVKSSFLESIANELRNPLTIIKGNTEKLQTKRNGLDISNPTEQISFNAKKMHLLVDQISDLSKVQAGNIKLQAQEKDVRDILKPTMRAFEAFTANTSKSFNWQIPDEEIKIYLDPQIFQKIIYNILAISLKTSDNNESINFYVNEIKTAENKNLEFSISYNAVQWNIKEDISIKPNHKLQLDSLSLDIKIGFELINLLTAIHYGSFIFNLKKQTPEVTIKLLLPLGKSHLLKDEIQLQNKEYNSAVPYYFATGSQSENNNYLVNENLKDFRILVIYSETSFRKFISDTLIEKYNIIEAPTILRGLEIAKKRMPELIICELIKENNEGIEFCRKIKNDPLTNHIPIVLISDGISPQEKTNCFEAGADEFLFKPFNISDFEIRINNLIMQREVLKEKFRLQFLSSTPDKLNLKEGSEEFLNRAKELLEQELENNEFTVETFAEKMGLSRVQMHRKLKSLVGLNTSEFIRNYRLEKAASLITNSQESLTQISYMVGFSNPSYFAQCFKDYFGKSPSLFQKTYAGKSI